MKTRDDSVTISLEKPIRGISCREIVQELWGSEAGGHDGIAGSPRGKSMTEKDLINAAEALNNAIKGKETSKKASVETDWVGIYLKC